MATNGKFCVPRVQMSWKKKKKKPLTHTGCVGGTIIILYMARSTLSYLNWLREMKRCVQSQRPNKWWSLDT